jgi:hypothetical protein
VDTRNHTSAPCRRRNFFSPALRLGKHSGQEATCKVTEAESGKALVIPRNELHSCCIARSDVRVGREVEICKAKHRPTSTPQAAAGFCNGRGKRFPADFLRRWSGKSEHAPSALTQQQTEDAGLARTARSYFPWSNMEWPRARGRCGPQYQCRLQGAAMNGKRPSVEDAGRGQPSTIASLLLTSTRRICLFQSSRCGSGTSKIGGETSPARHASSGRPKILKSSSLTSCVPGVASGSATSANHGHRHGHIRSTGRIAHWLETNRSRTVKHLSKKPLRHMLLLRALDLRSGSLADVLEDLPRSNQRSPFAAQGLV